MSAWGKDYDEPYDPGPDDNPSQQEIQRLEQYKRAKDGATFILDTPTDVPAIWGHGQDVLWAHGESCMIAGPPGVGKTTVAAQLVRGRLGIDTKVLDQPIQPGEQKVLYLAMDRPAQIARALRRNFTEADRQILEERLTVWQGPPSADVAKHPEILIGMADIFTADTIIIDSLKDAAIGLTDDEVAAGYNRARQLALAEGVQILELHHQVKRGAGGGKPNTLADVYGSAWLTAGAGSVVLLYGEAGDPIVDFRHLKQPAAEVGPWQVLHDSQTGISALYHPTDLLQLAQAAGRTGIDAKRAACALFGTEKPTTSQIEKARRKLEQLVKNDHLIAVPGYGVTDPTTYLRAALVQNLPFTPAHDSRSEAAHAPVTDPAPHEPLTLLTSEDKTAGQSAHDPAHAAHAPGRSRSAPPLKGGQDEPHRPKLVTPTPPSITVEIADYMTRTLGALCPECNYRGDHALACPNNTLEPGDEPA